MKPLLAVLFFALTGCAATDHRFQPDNAKVAIQYATLQFINNDYARALRVIKIARKIQDEIAKDPERDLVRVEDIRNAIQSHIPNDMAPEDRLLLNTLTDRIVKRLVGEDKIHLDLVPQYTTIEVDIIADWISEAARWTIPARHQP